MQVQEITITKSSGNNEYFGRKSYKIEGTEKV